MTTTMSNHAGSVLIFTSLLGLLPTAVYPGSNAAVSARERGWRCQRCPVEQAASGAIEVGAVRVPTDSFKFGDYTGLDESVRVPTDSFKFGDYTGLDEDKVYVTGNAEAHYRGKDARYGDLEGSNLGLESRTVDIEGGRQGEFGLGLLYDELPHLVEDSAATPFLNTGSSQDSLALPDNWVPANSTRNMTTLPTSLQEVDIHTKRKTLQGGFSYLPSQHVELVGKVNRSRSRELMRSAGRLAVPLVHRARQSSAGPLTTKPIKWIFLRPIRGNGCSRNWATMARFLMIDRTP